MNYTANKTYGIGTITETAGIKVTVQFENVEKVLIKSLVTVYNAREEAEAALGEMTDEEIAQFTEARNIDIQSGEKMAEINKENARENLPSSLR